MRHFKNLLLFIPLAVLAFGFCFQGVIKNPHMFLSAGGDGMKNYYTFLYHVKHDSSYMHFEGMNYPFGENIVFTDNQPILVNAVKFAVSLFPALECKLPSIHNHFLWLGMIMGAIGFFLCFRELEVGVYFSIVAAIALILMNPQTMRLYGHFALSYPVLPWIIWAWIRYWKGSSYIKSSVFVGLVLILSGLTHMYHFVLGAIFIGLAMFCELLFRKEKIDWWFYGITSLVQLIIPFATLSYVSKLSNVVADRPTEPWGFFNYHGYWEGLFFSYKLPLYNFINGTIIKVRTIDFEAKSYVGLLAVGFILWGLYYMLRRFSKVKAFLQEGTILSRLLIIFLLSTVVAMGLPFIIPGLEFLLDYTGPFKQFRSIGRVAWVSHYCINLLAIKLIYDTLHSLAKPIWKNTILVGLSAFMLWESYSFFAPGEIQQYHNDAYYCGDYAKQFGVNAEDYQAILPDPFFHVGSEAFSWEGFYNITGWSFEISYSMGIPIMGVMMSRTSLEQAFLLNELVCAPIKIPAIIEDLKQNDQRPLLVIQRKEIPWEGYLTHWTGNTPILFENEQYRLRRLELSVFDSISHAYQNQLPESHRIDLPEFNFDASAEKRQSYRNYVFSVADEMKGDVRFTYTLECLDHTYLMSTTRIIQYDQSGQPIKEDFFGNRHRYVEINGSILRMELPIHVPAEAHRIEIQFDKFKLDDKDRIKVAEAALKRTN
jgi:hypothetical protein